MSSVEMPQANQSEAESNPDVKLVINYIRRIWNQQKFTELSDYLHDHYVDHAMPYVAFQNRDGLLLYLRELAQTVSHTTEIVGLTTLGELVICYIRITVSSLTVCEDDSQQNEVFFGYRTFQMFNSKIAEHWEFF